MNPLMRLVGREAFIAEQERQWELFLDARREERKEFLQAQGAYALEVIYTPMPGENYPRRELRFSVLMDAQEQEYQAFAAKQSLEIDAFFIEQRAALELCLNLPSTTD